VTTAIPSEFLADIDADEIEWSRPSAAPSTLSTEYVLIGNGADAFEVAVATAPSLPKINDIRNLLEDPLGQRAAPVLLVVVYDDQGTAKAAACGTRDDPALLTNLDLRHLERICAAALREHDSMAADRTLHRLLVGQRDQLIAGLTNQGLFASHELRYGVPRRADWVTAQAAGANLLGAHGLELIRGLGYTTTPVGTTAQILAVDDTRRAVAVLLDEGELFDRPAHRFGATSPVAQGLKVAKDQGVPWLVIIRGTEGLRAVVSDGSVGPGAGVLFGWLVLAVSMSVLAVARRRMLPAEVSDSSWVVPTRLRSG
jgi:hypothetical protein